MPRTDTPRRDKRSNLTFLETAREFYGSAFGTRRARSLERARDDWADLPEEDRSFAVAHLLYLDLMAQAGTARLLLQIRDVLEEIADGLMVDEDEPEDDDVEDEELDDEPSGDLDAIQPPQDGATAPQLALAQAQQDDDDDQDDDDQDDEPEDDDDDFEDDDFEDDDQGGAA